MAHYYIFTATQYKAKSFHNAWSYMERNTLVWWGVLWAEPLRVQTGSIGVRAEKKLEE